MDASSESEPERFYVGRGDQTFGPYAAAEIQQYWNDQQLVEGDHIWLATEERWVPISEFLNRSSPSQIQDPPPAELIPEDACISQSPKSAPLCFCPAHPDTYAVGHCHRCTKFLCAQCVRYRAGGFYCAECVKFAEGRVEKGTSGFMEQVILVFRERPVFGVCLMLIAFLFLSAMTGAMKEVKTKGVQRVETEMYLVQSWRAQRMADRFLEREETRRSNRWYQLQFDAAGHVVADKTVDDDVRGQCIAMQIRAVLQKEDYETMDRIMAEFSKEAKELNREDDYNFYRACLLYLHRDDTFEARTIFSDLKEKLIPKDNKWSKMFAQLTQDVEDLDPRFAVLFGEGQKRSFNNAELLYRYGECLDKSGKPAEAKDLWKEAIQQGGKSIWIRKAEERLRS